MKLLALVESPDHVCCRYRIRAFAPALDDAGWSVSYQGFDRGVAASSLPAPPGDGSSTRWFCNASSCRDGN